MADEKVESISVELSSKTPIQQNLELSPMIHVDGAVGLATSNDGIVRFNLFQDRLVVDPRAGEEGAQLARTVCVRLVMTQRTALAIRDWITRSFEASDPHDAED